MNGTQGQFSYDIIGSNYVSTCLPNSLETKTEMCIKTLDSCIKESKCLNADQIITQKELIFIVKNTTPVNNDIKPVDDSKKGKQGRSYWMVIFFFSTFLLLVSAGGIFALSKYYKHQVS